LAFPLQLLRISRFAMTKANPGRPWIFLLLVEMRKSMPNSLVGISYTPNELTASKMKIIFLFNLDMKLISLIMPEVVSEWIILTWVIVGSSSIYLMMSCIFTFTFSS